MEHIKVHPMRWKPFCGQTHAARRGHVLIMHYHEKHNSLPRAFVKDRNMEPQELCVHWWYPTRQLAFLPRPKHDANPWPVSFPVRFPQYKSNFPCFLCIRWWQTAFPWKLAGASVSVPEMGLRSRETPHSFLSQQRLQIFTNG